jgi:hypothetical protein
MMLMLETPCWQTMTGQSKLASHDRMISLVLCTAIKIADLSHTFAEFNTHKRWSEMLEEELFLQGDVERNMGRCSARLTSMFTSCIFYVYMQEHCLHLLYMHTYLYMQAHSFLLSLVHKGSQNDILLVFALLLSKI